MEEPKNYKEANLELEAKEVVRALLATWKNFIGRQDVKTEITVSKKNGFYIEDIRLSDPTYLCNLQIVRRYYPVSGYTEDNVEITIRWFDWSDELKYTSNYFAQMTNEAVIAKTKLLIKAADSLAKSTHLFERKN